MGSGADSGFHVHQVGVSGSGREGVCGSSSISPAGGGGIVGGEEIETGTDLSLSAAVVAMERCSLASSGFQSHSRNSSFESSGMTR